MTGLGENLNGETSLRFVENYFLISVGIQVEGAIDKYQSQIGNTEYDKCDVSKLPAMMRQLQTTRHVLIKSLFSSAAGNACIPFRVS